jgi:cytoplasmic iron level regulating protein YaaA (DUF328/UPF0246 family)
MQQDRPIILVACCGPKLSQPSPAADLYVSSLFRKSRKYAERLGRWFILSALHGLLDPATVIGPYDMTLTKMSAQERRAWGEEVRDQIENAELIEFSLIALAGAEYVKPLAAAGLTVAQPMKGFRFGDWHRWLDNGNG